MEKKKMSFIKGTLVAGALISVSALSATPNASSLFDYSALGSGAEVRSEILHSNTSPFNNFEAKCGEKSATTTKTTASEGKKAEAKCGEGKCGEGKCGDKKAATDTKTNAKTTDAKVSTTKVSATTATTKEAETKSKEAKCGEGKCGVE
jgi:uncharacterized low-complexity protein